MFGWFKKKQEVQTARRTESNTVQSLEQLENTKTLLEKRESLLQKNLEKEDEKARALIKEGKRDAAKQCLVRKKKIQADIDKLVAQKENLDTMIMKIQEASLNVEVINNQIQAAKSLKDAFGNMDADKVADQMDDIRDVMQNAEDISNTLAQTIDVNGVVDDDELMDEMAQLEEVVSIERTKVKSPPSKVKKPIAKEEIDEELEDEFAALQAQLA
jgi:charged multivesicular body protein 4